MTPTQQKQEADVSSLSLVLVVFCLVVLCCMFCFAFILCFLLCVLFLQSSEDLDTDTEFEPVEDMALETRSRCMRFLFLFLVLRICCFQLVFNA